MTTKTTSPIKAYSVMATGPDGAVHHLCDVPARSAWEAVKLVKASGRPGYRDFVAHRIHLADIDDDDLRQAMSEWMDRNGVESR
jgi:hypothetical protein